MWLGNCTGSGLICHELPLLVEMATKQPLPYFQPSGGAWSSLWSHASLTKNKFPSASRINDGCCALPSGGNGDASLSLQLTPQFVEKFSGDQPLTLAFLPPMESKLPRPSSGSMTECRPPVLPGISCQ